MSAIDRREFLRRGTFLLAAASMPGFLAACSKKAAAPTGFSDLSQLTSSLVHSGAKQGLQVFMGGEDYVVGLQNRLPLGLVDAQGAPVTGKTATIWLAPGGALQGKPIGPFQAPYTGYTKPEASPAPQGVNAFTTLLNQPGPWQIVVEVDSGSGKILGTAAFQAKTKSDTRIPGQRAIPSQTPTVTNHHGVTPICTRTPPCDMHKIELAKALTLGKPVAFITATPKFCMSRTCGPNLEELLIIESEVRDRASFVHAEVYRDDKPDTIQRQITSPTFGQWGFQSEPWLFLIDKTGVIQARFEGPVTAETIRPALQPLLA